MSFHSYFKQVVWPWLNIHNAFFFFGWACLFILPPVLAWIPFVLSFLHIQWGRWIDSKNRVSDLAEKQFAWEKEKITKEVEARSIKDKEVIMENMKRIAAEIESINTRISFIRHPSNTGPTFVKLEVPR